MINVAIFCFFSEQLHAKSRDEDKGDGEERDDLGGQGGVRLLKKVPQAPSQEKRQDQNADPVVLNSPTPSGPHL